MDPQTAILRRVRQYCDQHPLTPARDVQARFCHQPAERVRRPEFLLRGVGCWYVRWPNGTLKWETTAALERRGFTIPRQPLVGEWTDA